MKAKSFVWGAAFVFLFFGALLALVVSAPKQERETALPLAPFYQKQSFLIEVESDGNKMWESALASNLSAAKYSRTTEAVPINAKISMDASGILVVPENEILCLDGRSIEMDLPAAFADPNKAGGFTGVIRFLDLLAAKQEAACGAKKIEI